MIRRVCLILVLCVIWLGVFAWSAGVPWNAPIMPRENVVLGGQDLHVQFGSGALHSGALQVDALGADGNGLQTAPLPRLRAENFPVLRYRIADFPDTLELALVFRRSDAPDDVQTISLPAPGRGEVAVDLATLPDWHGQITELGFAEYATAQLVPPSVASFAPFRIEQVRLQSTSWSEVFARLRSDWFGYRPWAFYSISALGPQIATLPASWMQSALVLGSVLSLLAVWVMLGWTRRRVMQAGIVVACAVWVLLDLRWLDDLNAKHRVIEKLFAGKSWEQRAVLQSDEDTFVAAREVTRLAAEHDIKRVLVLSDTNYTFLRFIYFLLPLNAAPMLPTLTAAPGAPLPPDTLIAVFNSEWKYDEADGVLTDGHTKIAVKPVFAQGELRVFRPREHTS